MRLLAVDPGAERCGWAVLDSEDGIFGPQYVESGVLKFHRGGMDFQEYRLALEQISYQRLNSLLDYYDPDIVVNEIIPAVGGGNFVAATQSYLANTMVTSLHVMTYLHGCHVAQISARTVHKAMVGVTKKGQKVSKVQIRNAVVKRIPHLVEEIKERNWTKEFDEPDACAIGITYFDLH